MRWEWYFYIFHRGSIQKIDVPLGALYGENIFATKTPSHKNEF